MDCNEYPYTRNSWSGSKLKPFHYACLSTSMQWQHSCLIGCGWLLVLTTSNKSEWLMHLVGLIYLNSLIVFIVTSIYFDKVCSGGWQSSSLVNGIISWCWWLSKTHKLHLRTDTVSGPRRFYHFLSQQKRQVVCVLLFS